jgi:acylphosphatase
VKIKLKGHVKVVQDGKIKLKGHVKVVQDGNNEVTMRDDLFQLDELVYLYQVALSTEIEEN